MSLLTTIREKLGNFGANMRDKMEAPRMERYETSDKYLNYLRFKAQLLKEKNEKARHKEMLKKAELQRDRSFNFGNKISNQKVNISKQPALFKLKPPSDHNNIFRRR